MTLAVDTDINALAEELRWYWDGEEPSYRQGAVDAAIDFFKTRKTTKVPNLKFNSDAYVDFIEEFSGVECTAQEIALAARSLGIYTSTSKTFNEPIKFYFACNPDKVQYTYYEALKHDDAFESTEDMLQAIYHTLKEAKGRYGWLSLATDKEPSLYFAGDIVSEVEFVVDQIRFGGYKTTNSLFFKLNEDLKSTYPGVKRISFMLACLFMGINYKIYTSKSGERDIILAMSKAK